MDEKQDEQTFSRSQFVAWGRQGAERANARGDRSHDRRAAIARARSIATVAFLRQIDPCNELPLDVAADRLTEYRGERIREGLRRRRERLAMAAE